MVPGDETPLLSGSMADEEAAMRKGKGGMLWMMGGLAVALIAGLALVMGGGDQERVYGELGRQINGLKQANFDQFWGCALEGEDLRDIRTNEDLTGQIVVRAREHGRSYGVHVREDCLPKLTDIGPQLDMLIIPDDLKPGVEGMKEATSKLRSGWSGFVAYLDDPELTFDEEKARPFLADVARGWYDFRKAHADVNKTLKSKLDE